MVLFAFIFIIQGKGNAQFNLKNMDLLVIPTSGVTGTSESVNSMELFRSLENQNANEDINTLLADANVSLSANRRSLEQPYIDATACDDGNNTSELITVIPQDTCCDHLSFCFPDIICAGEAVTVTNGSTGCGSNPVFSWDYGDNTPATDSMTHIFTNPGYYTVTLSVTCGGVEDRIPSVSLVIHVIDCAQPCINCIGSFSPEPGKKYIVSAWVKENNPPVTKTSYNNPQIYIEFTKQDNSITTIGPDTARGNIIDGWQRIEEEFDIPENTVYLKIELKSVSGDSYFDDIRVFPVDATVKSYVYNPINLRLVSELDERNYATFYEYDEEGKLVRVKKETERGVMTIKESKNSIMKK